GRTYVSARKRAITQDCPYAEHRHSYFREAALPLQSTSSPLWGGSSPSFQCFGVTSKGRPLMEYSLALWIWTWSFPRNFTSRRTCSDSRCSSFATEGSLRISNSPWMLTAMLLSATLPTRLPFVS